MKFFLLTICTLCAFVCAQSIAKKAVGYEESGSLQEQEMDMEVEKGRGIGMGRRRGHHRRHFKPQRQVQGCQCQGARKKGGKPCGECHRRKPCRCAHRRSSHGDFEFRSVPVRIDAGFYAFRFKQAGEAVKTSFNFFSKGLTVLHVNDCFCAGSYFDIFDSGVFLQTTHSSAVSNNCLHFTDQPYVCYSDMNNSPNFWSWASIQLNPGIHNITLVPSLTPYGKGTGFLRVDSSCSASLCCTLSQSCQYKVVRW